jgi:hypothetical protein
VTEDGPSSSVQRLKETLQKPPSIRLPFVPSNRPAAAERCADCMISIRYANLHG